MKFIDLVWRECCMIGQSILYFAFLFVLVLSFSSQYAADRASDLENITSGNRVTINQYGEKSINPFVEPKETDGFYGYKKAEVPEQVMPRVAVTLYRECRDNKYASYPYDFIKWVKLSKDKQERAGEIFQEITGYTISEYNDIVKKRYQMQQEEISENGDGNVTIDSTGYYEIPIAEILSYQQFKERMLELEEMIGPESSYSNLERYGREEISYEDASKAYDSLVKKDKVSGAYARLFCDYMGIFLAIFPAFVAVAYARRDKRAGIRELVNSRQLSSVKLIGARYLALVLMMFLPILVLCIPTTWEIYSMTKPLGLPIDILAFFKYSIAWLLPTLMFTVSLSYFLTELTQTAIGILVQVALWFLTLNKTPLVGGYEWSFFLRHNSIMEYGVYEAGISEIWINRITYVIVAIGLVLMTSALFARKRKGRWYGKRRSVKVPLDHQ